MSVESRQHWPAYQRALQQEHRRRDVTETWWLFYAQVLEAVAFVVGTILFGFIVQACAR